MHHQEQAFLRPLTGKRRQRNFATYDLETTTDLTRVYLCGFFDGHLYRHFDSPINGGKESQAFFPEEAGSPVDRFLRWIMKDHKYCGWWLYAHNAGNFDSLYLIRWLLENSKDYYFEVTPVQATVLCLEIHDRWNRKGKWTFIDSLRLMNAKLEKLGQAFGLGGKVK